MICYFLIFGSNFGYSVTNIYAGIERLARAGVVESVSSLYVTEPVGRKYQAGFVNCGVKYRSALRPDELIWSLKNIEKDFGRRFALFRGHRPLDIDVAAGNRSHSSSVITIPHPELNRRRFMLVPLCELDPEFPGGEDGATFRDLLSRCEDDKEVIMV